MRQSNRSKLVVTMLSAVLLLLAANPVWVQERPDPDELKNQVGGTYFHFLFISWHCVPRPSKPGFGLIYPSYRVYYPPQGHRGWIWGSDEHSGSPEPQIATKSVWNLAEFHLDKSDAFSVAKVVFGDITIREANQWQQIGPENNLVSCLNNSESLFLVFSLLPGAIFYPLLIYC